MDRDDQKKRTTAVNSKLTEQGRWREILKRLGQIFYPRAARIDVHSAAQHAVDDEGKDQGRDPHDRNPPAVDETDHNTDQNTHHESKQPVVAIAEHTAHHSGHKAEAGTDRNVDLPDDDGKRHSYCDQNVNHRGVKDRSDVFRWCERRVDQAHDHKQGNQEQQAGCFPRLERLFDQIHAFASFSLPDKPKDALVRLSCVTSSPVNSPFKRPW